MRVFLLSLNFGTNNLNVHKLNNGVNIRLISFGRYFQKNFCNSLNVIKFPMQEELRLYKCETDDKSSNRTNQAQ